jgi:hypothetical protein
LRWPSKPSPAWSQGPCPHFTKGKLRQDLDFVKLLAPWHRQSGSPCPSPSTSRCPSTSVSILRSSGLGPASPHLLSPPTIPVIQAYSVVPPSRPLHMLFLLPKCLSPVSCKNQLQCYDMREAYEMAHGLVLVQLACEYSRVSFLHRGPRANF